MRVVSAAGQKCFLQYVRKKGIEVKSFQPVKYLERAERRQGEHVNERKHTSRPSTDTPCPSDREEESSAEEVEEKYDSQELDSSSSTNNNKNRKH